LSVKPGLTGLWQLRRTREPGLDFQEWIRYDIEYVEKASFGLDLKIFFSTFFVVLGKGSGHASDTTG
ncbi:MAG: sugar transferase, partial [Planctomycetota bacterium]|nr:sugar transferase [Planctomycetota bacterium]